MGKKRDKDRIENLMESANVATKIEAIEKLKLQEYLAYISNDTFMANPYALLGKVIQIRKKDGVCPNELNDPNYKGEFLPKPIPNTKIDEASKLNQPQLMDSIIIDNKLSMGVSFLSFFSAQLDENSYFSLMVFNQATGRVNADDSEWSASIDKWASENAKIIDDPEVCYLFVITGFVQKNIIRKKYVKLNGKAKGGAYGVNINGELANSTEQYSLDIRFGLDPGIIKRPGPRLGFAPGPSFSKELTDNEKKLFESLTGATVNESNVLMQLK